MRIGGAVAVLGILASCSGGKPSTCVPDVSFSGSSSGPLFGATTQMKQPMVLHFSVKMDRSVGDVNIEQWDGAAWKPLAPSKGFVSPLDAHACSVASPAWTDDTLSFDWFPASFDTCDDSARHWPEASWFRWRPSGFRSASEVGACEMEANKWTANIYFDTCRFDSTDRCVGKTAPPDYK